jgi:hypothetical protein
MADGGFLLNVVPSCYTALTCGSSDAASIVTGHPLTIDGGWAAR